jgi:hypothetical protein
MTPEQERERNLLFLQIQQLQERNETLEGRLTMLIVAQVGLVLLFLGWLL